MSVLIKGMEMPTSCGDCKAFVCYKQWAGDMGDCFCGITKEDAKAKEKNADCPFVHAADVVPARDLRDCRNELCLRCGSYKQAHNGACDGCRWRDVG